MQKKIVSLSEAVAEIPDGASIGLPGFSIARTAIAFAHEVIRQGKRHLTLSTCAAGSTRSSWWRPMRSITSSTAPAPWTSTVSWPRSTGTSTQGG